MDNRHRVSVPKDVIAEVKKMIAEIFKLLEPYLIALTPEEKRRMIKMGEKTLSFVSKSYELAQNNPNICPKYFDMNEFRIDFEDATRLLALKVAINQIYESISDTEMIAGSEAYQAALLIYSAAKEATKQDIYGAKAVSEELKKCLPTKKKGKDKAAKTDSE